MGGFLVFIGLIGIVVAIIGLIVKAIQKRPKKKMLTVLVVFFVCFVVGAIIMPSPSAVDDLVAEPSMAEQPMDEEQVEIEEPEQENATQETDDIASEQEADEEAEQEPIEVVATGETLTKDEISGLSTFGSYKDLLRTPDNYIGQYIVLTVKISQVLEGGWFDDNIYYFGRTDNDGYNFYFDDEYCFLDKRVDDTTKLLENDILKVYGRFVGLQTFQRALTGTNTELPQVEMLYVEIIE